MTKSPSTIKKQGAPDKEQRSAARNKQMKKKFGGEKPKEKHFLSTKEATEGSDRDTATKAIKQRLWLVAVGFLLFSFLLLYFLPDGSWSWPLLEGKASPPDKSIQTSLPESDDYIDFCTLYVAPSSVGGDSAGLGVYAGVNFTKNEVLTKVPDAALLVEPATTAQDEASWIWHSYLWLGGSNAGFPHRWAHQVWLAGFGSLANSHTGLANLRQINYETPHLPQRHLRLDASFRQTYHQPSPQLWHVTRNVSAGEELFVQYGEEYFRRLEEDLDNGFLFPFARHFDAANQYLRRFVDANKQSLERLQQEGSRDLRRALQKQWREKLEGLRQQGTEDYRRSVVALPTRVEDLLRAADVGTASLSVTEQPRSLEWIRQHGACLDGIRPTPSSSGPEGWVRSAFTTRPFAEGDVVSVVPLLPFSRDQLQGHKALQSHCFGHAKSSLLLCPYWSSILWIQPSTTATGTKSSPNVKLRWTASTSLGGIARKDLWAHEPSVEQVVYNQTWTWTHKLIWDLVATRPLEMGEEVILDLEVQVDGEEWSDNLRQHDDSSPFGNEYAKTKDISIVLTTEEQKRQPSYFQTFCYYDYFYHSRVVNQNSSSEQHLRRWRLGGGTFFFQKCLRPCDVLERNEGGKSHLYTVRMRNLTKHPDDENPIPRELMDVADDGIRTHVPRWAIRLIPPTEERPGGREMRVSTDLFPPAWLDLQQ